jgi:hypothetical protein
LVKVLSCLRDWIGVNKMGKNQPEKILAGVGNVIPLVDWSRALLSNQIRDVLKNF